jgi:hypothetical protein
MRLFDHLWGHAPTCTHNDSAALRSEIGHDANRRYYWFCGRCGNKVYVQSWNGHADGVSRAPGRRAITGYITR